VMLLAAGGVGVSDLSGTQIIGCSLMLALMLGLSWYALEALSRSASLLSFGGLLLLYLWVGFPLKFAGLVNFGNLFWIAELPLAGVTDTSAFVTSFYLCALGLVPFVAGIVFAGKIRPVAQGGAQRKVSYSSALFVWIGILLALKVGLQVFLDIGRPGIENNAFSVPFLTGVLTFAVSFYLTVLVNIAFFVAASDRNVAKTRTSIALIIILVFSDLVVGIKNNLVIEAVLFMFYAWISGFRLNSRKGLRMVILSLVALTAVGVLFKYVNYYRYAMISGSDVSASIDFAKRILEQRDESTGIALLNRINGLDNFVAAVSLGQQYQFGIDALLDTQIMDRFNFQLYGGDVVATQFGLTQFGALYVTGGVPLLCAGALLIGVLVRLLFSFFDRRIFRSVLLMSAFSPLLAFWVMKFLFASGFFSLYLKEIVFLLIALWCTIRVFFRPAAAEESLRNRALTGTSVTAPAPYAP
jgi:hypothetical protein